MKQHKRLFPFICTWGRWLEPMPLYPIQFQTASAYEGEGGAIRGANPSSQLHSATIAKGNVVIRNGLIVAVGADAAIPAMPKS